MFPFGLKPKGRVYHYAFTRTLVLTYGYPCRRPMQPLEFIESGVSTRFPQPRTGYKLAVASSIAQQTFVYRPFARSPLFSISLSLFGQASVGVSWFCLWVNLLVIMAESVGSAGSARSAQSAGSSESGGSRISRVSKINRLGILGGLGGLGRLSNTAN